MIFDRLLPVAMFLALVSGYNYCNNKTHACNLAGTEHFMCRLDSELTPYRDQTRFHAVFPDSPTIRTEVLGLINNFRDILASGTVFTSSNKTFPSAKRMRVLIWDKELAYMGRMHASTVSFKHSECKSTVRFPVIGEIMAVMMVPQGKKNTIKTVLREAFRPMWREHWKVEDPESVLEGFDPIRDYKYGHFTIMVNDRASRVGCGLAVGSNCPHPHKEEVGFCHFLTCYFDYNNVVNVSVYVPGEPASGCIEWKTTGSNKWGTLCKNVGEIFPPM